MTHHSHHFADMDTDAGGPRDFATTAWSQLSGAANPYASLRHLAERYWKPVYCFVRAQRRCTNEDAKDLTQEFFLWVIESGMLSKLRSDAGRFRGFLKTALANFLTDRHRASHAQKRGGLAHHLSLDLVGQVPADELEGRQTPDVVLDRRWKEAVVAQAMVQLEAEFRRDGKEAWVALWRDYDASPETVDHASLAERYSITPREVAYWLSSVRRRLREIIVELVAQTVTDPEALRAELRELFGQE